MDKDEKDKISEGWCGDDEQSGDENDDNNDADGDSDDEDNDNDAADDDDDDIDADEEDERDWEKNWCGMQLGCFDELCKILASFNNGGRNCFRSTRARSTWHT